MSLEWKSCKIGDVVSVRRGASPRPIKDYVSETGVPWVKIADATSDQTRFLSSTKEFIKEEGVKSSVTVYPGDLIVSNSATPGLPKFMKIKACVHDGWLVFDNYDGILKEYLYYYFIVVRDRLVNQANGSVFKNLKTDIVKDFDIDLPPLETQEKIVSILSSIDEKIEKNIAINNNLFKQLISLYKDWMFNFTPFKDKSFKSSSFGLIPEDWNVGTLGDIIEIFDSKRVPLSGNDRENMEKIYPYYGAASLMDYVDDYIFDGTYLLIGEDGTVTDDKGFPILQYVWGKFWVNNHAHIVKGKKGFNVESLYLLLSQTNIQSIVTGAVQPKVNQNNLKSLEVIIPSKNVMKEFNELIKPFFEAIKTNEMEIENLTKLRDVLLPKLMSGEIDVSEVNCD